MSILLSNIAVSLAAIWQWQRSETRRAIADAGRLASESQFELNQRFDLSLLLANAATRLSPIWQARNSQLTSLQSHPHLLAFLAGHKLWVVSVAFSPDGKTLVSGSADNMVILWVVGLESWRELACAIANRNLTCEKWRSSMGERPYRKVCERLPAPRCP